MLRKLLALAGLIALATISRADSTSTTAGAYGLSAPVAGGTLSLGVKESGGTKRTLVLADPAPNGGGKVTLGYSATSVTESLGFIRAGDGTASLPGFAFADDLETGLLNVTDNQVKLISGAGVAGAGNNVAIEPGTVDVTVGSGDTIRAVVNGTTEATINAGGLVLSDALPLSSGGTGAIAAAGARTNLGLGTIATQAASAVSITGGSVTGITDITVADGGTGASTAATARTNLGLGSAAVEAYDTVSDSDSWLVKPFAATGTFTHKAARLGHIVTLTFLGQTYTCNAANQFTSPTGSIASGWRPANNMSFPIFIRDNSAWQNTPGELSISTAGSVAILRNQASAAFTASGTCGYATMTVSYLTF